MSRALIVIDVQESFRQDPGWETISNPGIVGPVKQLVDAARANGDLEYALAGRFATIRTVAELTGDAADT